MQNIWRKTKRADESGIRTHAPEETGALNQRLRPLGHLASWRRPNSFRLTNLNVFFQTLSFMFLGCIMLFMGLVPISFHVTLEFTQELFIRGDMDMYDEKKVLRTNGLREARPFARRATPKMAEQALPSTLPNSLEDSNRPIATHYQQHSFDLVDQGLAYLDTQTIS